MRGVLLLLHLSIFTTLTLNPIMPIHVRITPTPTPTMNTQMIVHRNTRGGDEDHVI